MKVIDFCKDPFQTKIKEKPKDLERFVKKMPNTSDNSKSLKKTQTHATHTCFFIFVSEKDSFFWAYLTSVTSSISGLELKVINPPFFGWRKKKKKRDQLTSWGW